MVDYRRFLAKRETLVLPWLGGTRVDARDRVLRLLGPAPARAGWYSFEVSGRSATLLEPSPAPDTSALERVRGWLCGERLFVDGRTITPVRLLPEDEPPLFSPVSARRWSPHCLVFDGLEFETDAEAGCREALASERGIEELKGVAAALRAAFGLAVLERAAERNHLELSAHEVRAQLADVAQKGPARALEVLTALEAERAQARRELAELEHRRREALVRRELELQREALRERREAELRQVQGELADVRARLQQRWRPGENTAPRRHRGDVEERAELALTAAGAQLESLRRINGGELEVVFEYAGERFISIVDGATLQVIDSGICLGHPPADELITLESLPGVIDEAIETDRLVFLRRP